MELISNVPSSSSSSNTSQFKYDVFLSFRGEDTRYNFISHLYKVLRDKQIETFIDYKLNRDVEISQSLFKAIEESNISVIIFSEGYASSGWCLEGLVKILECKKSYGQIVIPVFYHVVPSDVRNQTGTFGDAFTKHDQQQSLYQVQRWKDALKEAANLSGWDSSTIKDESVLIENIVKDILRKLNNMSASDAKGLVGTGTKIEQIVSLLGRGDVCSVGIWGIGGIGKTTLAKAVFNKISSQFEGCCFITNIREVSEQSGGLNHLRREFLSKVLDDGNVNVGTASVRHAFTRKRLGSKKLLIVFDDVTDFQQIETLIGGFDCLNSQSRIIITTRDRQVLRNCGVDQVYEVQELSHHDALDLFCRHAFKENPPSEDYVELSKRVCEYTGGVPLALKVLGSFMCDRRKQEWVIALSNLERIANEDIQQVFKISYDGLNDKEKSLFLAIARFFIGKHKDFVINILNTCDFSAEIGISVLSDKSLISLSNDNIITMHNLLQAMAREIVRQESTVEPGKRSQLWNYDDIFHVPTKDKGTEMIEAISLDMSSSNATPWAFSKMDNLEVYVSDVSHNRGNKMEYLKPVNFYKEIFKDILIKTDYLKPGRLLGLDVSDKCVSLAVSDWKNLTAVPLRALDRQEINMSSMADMIQSFIFEHNLVGFVFTSKYSRPMDEQTEIFIDDLCKTRNFEGLKYTVWECGTTSKNAEFVFKQHLKFIIENLPQPQPLSKTIMEKCYAVSTLQGYLDATNKMLKEDWD